MLVSGLCYVFCETKTFAYCIDGNKLSVVKVHFCMFFTRTAALEKKLVFIERREKEETAALENMVHMVEKNLELTTVSSHGSPHCF